ncbi:MAG: Maf family protein, partial [Bacteroidia bacterium]|nr:Maf family protein [Bacteroidia bacterium]
MNAVEKTLKEFRYKLILGSASPRRQELLKSLGFEFTVKPINADESFPETLKAQKIPLF